MNHDLLLHHYEPSPYSEKIRLLLGYKSLAWRSVVTPPILPKPDLLALTGGYRRAPVLQAGADVYCDSTLIAGEIERRHPAPPLAQGPRAAAAALLGYLADADLFWRIARYVMGVGAAHVPQALLDDRAAMHPHIAFDRPTLAADLPDVAAHLCELLGRLDQALHAAPFLGGESVAEGDFAVYHVLWFLERARGVDALAPHATALRAWMGRIAAFGHGSPSPLTSTAALAVARAAEPAPLPSGLPSADTAFRVGSIVVVTPEHYEREAVRGELVYAGPTRVVVAHEGESVGRVHVHLPRLGYVLRTG
jgi:glutathione S-transferase